MALRIAQIAPLWTPVPPRTYGGVELLMAHLCDELVRRGHSVTLFSSGDSSTLAALRPVVERNLGDLFSEGLGWSYEHYANGAMAEAAAAQDQFDIIHVHLPVSWVPTAASFRTPTLFTMHTSPIPDDEWAFARWPHVPVVGISQAQLHEASKRLKRTFPVVYNGVDFDAFQPKWESGEYLAFLGRMSEAKNPLGAIQVAQKAGLPIVLAGQPQNAAEHQYFDSQIRPLIDGDFVQWMGPANHVQKNLLLRNAKALVFPITWDEPFGLVMIEAMACGTPVLGINRGSVAEIVEPGITGYHAPQLSGLAELVTATLGLDREKVCARARARFHFTSMVDGYEATYAELVKSRG